MSAEFNVWLDDYINQMQLEVSQNSYEVLETQGYVEFPEDHYALGLEHGGQVGVLNTLLLIKEKLK